VLGDDAPRHHADDRGDIVLLDDLETCSVSAVFAAGRPADEALAATRTATGGERGGPVGGERRYAEPDRGADQVVEMAFLRDVC
jgi:adenine deaminase